LPNTLSTNTVPKHRVQSQTRADPHLFSKAKALTLYMAEVFQVLMTKPRPQPHQHPIAKVVEIMIAQASNHRVMA
jgi:hypothetical protein